MRIEAVGGPVRYQWPDGEIRFEPGKPIQVDEVRGQKILKKCGGKVRMVSSSPFEVGDRITYRVPGDPPEGPYRVVAVTPDSRRPRWFATVEKGDAWVLIGQEIVTEVHRQ